ncbi:RNA-binding protein, putative [Entamoeba dispar SAW760]|uniref:RNA-binding protein, putative n=1 Tax=Entamoeba dispar (strain ATCC PRA-260 / SAW760) TaxID=370354 RepID=B0EQP9_ENTDS|nr:RNA-binding protein, putative [Entamoeba dispar SAW760]EDR23168.1 RNA-binding protein, putative [Entamoeba dispar SAW760]|eukprot:EDR23168.1 RNA-binding protein, putative [Entamoeba dispar SAW760]
MSTNINNTEEQLQSINKPYTVNITQNERKMRIQNELKHENNVQLQCVYVEGIPNEWKTDDLQNYFKQCSPSKVNVPIDKKTHLSKGYGFIYFYTSIIANNVIDNYNEKIIKGHKLYLQHANSQPKQISFFTNALKQSNSSSLKGIITVRIFNIPFTWKEHDVLEYFKEFHPLKALIIYDKESKISKGYAFIYFSSLNEANKVIQKFNGIKYRGKVFSLKLSQPNKEEKGQCITTSQHNVPQRKDKTEQKKIITLYEFSFREFPKNWTKDKIKKFIESFGVIIFSIKIDTNKITKSFTGCGSLKVKTREGAETIIKKVDGLIIENCQIKCKLKSSKQQLELQKIINSVTKEKTKIKIKPQIQEIKINEKEIKTPFKLTENLSENSKQIKNDENNTEPTKELKENEEAHLHISTPTEQKVIFEDDSDEPFIDSPSDTRIQTFYEENNNVLSLMVQGIPYRWNDNDLQFYFQQYNPIQSRVIYDDRNCLSLGFGFIDFYSVNDALSLVQDVHHFILEGRELLVFMASAKPINCTTPPLPPELNNKQTSKSCITKPTDGGCKRPQHDLPPIEPRHIQ